MPHLSVRWLIPVAVVVLVWGGAHALGTHSVPLRPAVWPGGGSSTARPSPPPSLPAASASPSATPQAAAGGVPFLPGALHQLNGSTRDTAVGLYQLIEELEAALGSRLTGLAHQLEPGR